MTRLPVSIPLISGPFRAGLHRDARQDGEYRFFKAEQGEDVQTDVPESSSNCKAFANRVNEAVALAETLAENNAKAPSYSDSRLPESSNKIS